MKRFLIIFFFGLWSCVMSLGGTAWALHQTSCKNSYPTPALDWCVQNGGCRGCPKAAHQDGTGKWIQDVDGTGQPIYGCHPIDDGTAGACGIPAEAHCAANASQCVDPDHAPRTDANSGLKVNMLACCCNAGYEKNSTGQCIIACGKTQKRNPITGVCEENYCPLDTDTSGTCNLGCSPDQERCQKIGQTGGACVPKTCSPGQEIKNCECVISNDGGINVSWIYYYYYLIPWWAALGWFGLILWALITRDVEKLPMARVLSALVAGVFVGLAVSQIAPVTQLGIIELIPTSFGAVVGGGLAYFVAKSIFKK